MRNKIAVGYRLTQVAINLVLEKSKELGVSKADVVEMAIRQFSLLANPKSGNGEKQKDEGKTQSDTRS